MLRGRAHGIGLVVDGRTAFVIFVIRLHPIVVWIIGSLFIQFIFRIMRIFKLNNLILFSSYRTSARFL